MCGGAGPRYLCLSGLWLFVVLSGLPALHMLRLGKVKETHRKRNNEKILAKIVSYIKVSRPSNLTGEEALNE